MNLTLILALRTFKHLIKIMKIINSGKIKRDSATFLDSFSPSLSSLSPCKIFNWGGRGHAPHAPPPSPGYGSAWLTAAVASNEHGVVSVATRHMKAWLHRSQNFPSRYFLPKGK
ncbi:unnamed protein product, partial [Meganyctiphanes norvegica]